MKRLKFILLIFLFGILGACGSKPNSNAVNVVKRVDSAEITLHTTTGYQPLQINFPPPRIVDDFALPSEPEIIELPVSQKKPTDTSTIMGLTEETSFNSPDDRWTFLVEAKCKPILKSQGCWSEFFIKNNGLLASKRQLSHGTLHLLSWSSDSKSFWVLRRQPSQNCTDCQRPILLTQMDINGKVIENYALAVGGKIDQLNKPMAHEIDDSTFAFHFCAQFNFDTREKCGRELWVYRDNVPHRIFTFEAPE